MTPEIVELEVQIAALYKKRGALVQAQLASEAIAQIGEIITWGKQGTKGRVICFMERYGACYSVVVVKKDGTDGRRTIVPFWDKPTLVAAPKAAA